MKLLKKIKKFVIKESDMNTDYYKNLYYYYFTYQESNYNVNGFSENLK